MNLRHTQRDSSGKRKPCLKEFGCCGNAALICFAHEGEIIFAMGGQHDGMYMEPPMLFKLKLQVTPPPPPQQNPTNEMQQLQPGLESARDGAGAPS